MSASTSRQQLQGLLSHHLLVGPNGVPQGATELDHQAFERRYGCTLPADLRDWFSVVNGAFCGTQRFIALDCDHGRADFLKRLWLPVAEDGCGNYYVADLSAAVQGDHPIYFWDHESPEAQGQAFASNVWDFSRQLLQRELARLET